MGDHKHYVLFDDQNRMIDGYSDAFPQLKKYELEYTLIAENADRQFELSGQVNPDIQNENGLYLYKRENGEIMRRTQAELDAEWAARPAPPPSQDDRMRAVEDWIMGQMFPL